MKKLCSFFIKVIIRFEVINYHRKLCNNFCTVKKFIGIMHSLPQSKQLIDLFFYIWKVLIKTWGYWFNKCRIKKCIKIPREHWIYFAEIHQPTFVSVCEADHATWSKNKMFAHIHVSNIFLAVCASLCTFVLVLSVQHSTRTETNVCFSGKWAEFVLFQVPIQWFSSPTSVFALFYIVVVSLE